MADGDLAFSTTSLGSRSSANSGISAGSRNRVVPWDTVSSGASAREPLLESARMTQPVSHLVSDDYGATQTSSLTDSGPDSRQASGMTQFAAEVYSTEVVRRSTSNTNVDNTRTPGILHGIQFLEADSTTVSGEYVNIKVRNTLIPNWTNCYGNVNFLLQFARTISQCDNAINDNACKLIVLILYSEGRGKHSSSGLRMILPNACAPDVGILRFSETHSLANLHLDLQCQ